MANRHVKRCSTLLIIQFSSVHFNSVVSDSLRPHESQHARPLCPSPTPRVHSDSRPSSDAIQPSHPLSSPSPPVFNPSKHQGIFQGVSSSQFSSVQFSTVAQSCPTLCDPMDCSLPGSSVHGIFQARVLEWGAIAFSLYIYQFSSVQLLSRVRLFATP